MLIFCSEGSVKLWFPAKQCKQENVNKQFAVCLHAEPMLIKIWVYYNFCCMGRTCFFNYLNNFDNNFDGANSASNAKCCLDPSSSQQFYAPMTFRPLRTSPEAGSSCEHANIYSTGGSLGHSKLRQLLPVYSEGNVPKLREVPKFENLDVSVVDLSIQTLHARRKRIKFEFKSYLLLQESTNIRVSYAWNAPLLLQTHHFPEKE